ncbi:hypothetical protein FSP39_007599 [Pinctada imbricata]|uniref:Uncharacterized protein n=1 Tax=Pinctada imbricata TaxID=66713 RepID=A0AA89BNU8_PINIB|nr:hypothetical protein FSP39_007599 [Pinctada imbricata]
MRIPCERRHETLQRYQNIQTATLNTADMSITNPSHAVQDENVTFRESCGTFPKSLEENLKIVTDYRFNVPLDYQRFLKLDVDGIENLKKRILGKTIPVIATAVSSNHFREIQSLIENIHENVMKTFDMKFILYDIGLTEPEAKIIQKNCRCDYRKFPFHKFPDHVRILRGYTWKPIIIQLVLIEYDFIMWVDASIRFHGNVLDSLFKEAYETEIKILPGGGSIADRTYGFTFNALGEDPCFFRRKEYSASCILIRRTNFTLHGILKPWVSCALQYGCMTSDNVEKIIDCRRNGLLSDVPLHRCHRFDQSVISILLTRLFNDNNDFLLIKYKEYLSKKRRLTSDYLEKLYYSDLSERKSNEASLTDS